MTDNRTWFTRRKPLVMLVVLLQVLVLSGLAVSYYAIGWFGDSIKVRTVPVDPRDLFYGDYVTLQYEISTIPLSIWQGSPERLEQGTKLYVVVKSGADGIYEAIAASDKPLEAGAGEYVLIGSTEYYWDHKYSGMGIPVRYGIEKFYVPENTGKALEEKADRLVVELKVAPWGKMKIEQLVE
ncbi:GDYXXLXY domain-containing protein [Paenibacillus sp. YYML68]|uniref:GDYXXLXY domain-containing protein n=1 Tax=Paenibacillus sp. YYML68 TaxID=2909250 RepID=UPI00248FC7CE|nr:GDYXXLXY domain-containing protein [Paenibacillus sp. YYML68]